MNITIEFSDEVAALIKKFAKSEKRTVNDFIRKAVLEKLEDLEDYEIAVKAWEEFKKSGEKTIPAEDVFKELGLE